MITTISRDELLQLMDGGGDFILIETLPTNVYDQGRLPGAINLPADQVARLAPRILPNKTAEIVVYCAGAQCTASLNAAMELASDGYANVRVYEGGKKDWFEAGLRIEVITSSGQPRKASNLHSIS